MSKKARRPNGQFDLDCGTYVDSKGYLAICAGPLRGMRLHKLVALAKFGTDALDPANVVHHRDGDKTNPHPDNLELMKAPIHNAVSARQYHYLKTHVWPRGKAEWDAYFAEANA